MAAPATPWNNVGVAVVLVVAVLAVVVVGLVADDELAIVVTVDVVVLVDPHALSRAEAVTSSNREILG